MKKLISVALALVLALSLVACTGGNSNTPNSGAIPTPAEGYDAEFTVIIGYGDEWTPFPGKPGVVFANSESSVISVTDDGTTVKFTGLAVGDSVITATLDGQESKALVKVRAIEGKTPEGKTPTINYKYNPPTDNYYIKYEDNTQSDFYEDGTVARIGDGYTYGNFAETELGHFSVSSGKCWLYYYDDYESVYRWTEAEDTEDSNGKVTIGPLSAMEDFFMTQFRLFGKSDSQLSEFYIGNEKIAGVDCWVFDTIGYKYWIDPSNGCCLKYENTETGSTTTVTEYNLNYTEWTGNLKP
jgi:hypothetical protein